MKKTGCFILLAIIMCSSLLFADVLRRYPNGTVKIEGTIIDGKIEGQVKKYSETGVLLETAMYENNQLSGEKRKYHPNGTVAAVEKYVQGKIDGAATTYYDTGEKQLVLQYTQGALRHYTAYTKSGKIDIDVDYTKTK